MTLQSLCIDDIALKDGDKKIVRSIKATDDVWAFS